MVLQDELRVEITGVSERSRPSFSVVYMETKQTDWRHLPSTQTRSDKLAEYRGGTQRTSRSYAVFHLTQIDADSVRRSKFEESRACDKSISFQIDSKTLP